MKSQNGKLQLLWQHHIEPKIPRTLQATAFLRGFGLIRVPLLFSVNPKVVRLEDACCVVRVPLNRWTKNHLGSMYFGALAIGADCVVGLLALHHIRKQEAGEVHFSFKDFKAEFLRRPEGPVLFICEAGKEISSFVAEVAASGERKNRTVSAHAVVENHPEEVVARFELKLSLKRMKK